VLIECGHCGAPLNVGAEQRVARCDYCRRSNEVLRANRLEPETPAGWTPPPAWTDAETGRTLPRRSSGARGLIVLGAAVAVLVAGLIPMLSILPSGSSSVSTTTSTSTTTVTRNLDGTTTETTTTTGGSSGSGLDQVAPALAKLEELQQLALGGAGAWDGTAPLLCRPNQHLVIDGRTVEGTGDGPLIHALGPNCELTIRNSTLRGQRGILGGPNARILVEDSTIDAETTGIEATVGGRVELRGESTVTGRETGIEGGTNLELVVEEPARVTAEGTAVDGQLNLRVTLRGGLIDGGDVGIRAGLNPRLRLDGGTVRGGDQALDLGMNADVRADATKIVGDVDTGRNADVQGLPRRRGRSRR